MLRLSIAIISLLVAVIQLQGQDTTVYKPKVLSPGLYWDYGKTTTLWTNFEQKTEVGAGLLLYEKIDVSAEFGIATLRPRTAFENVDYTVEGNYLRIGAGYLAKLDAKNRIGLELRYATANFSDRGDISYRTNSGFNNAYERTFERTDLSASWTELNLVSQRYLTLKKDEPEHWLNQVFSVGIKIRYRRLLSSTSIESDPEIYAIPGYGRADTDNLVALNLFLRANL